MLGGALSKSAELIDLFYSTLITISIFYSYFYFTKSFFLYPILLSVVITSFLVIYLASWSHKKLGGITGDIHGAIIELGELIFLLTLSIF
jgi:adenosylcobinamide-GDP ribazoletransferase